MASITIRNLDDTVKRRLRVRAAEHGRSMEEEAREILRQVVGQEKPAHNLAAAIRARVAPLGGVELDLPPREPMREPPTFDQA
ncbi:FitA-like ribbon-helix-helix domain-containing protein [Roseovarius autotrophicus]|uniref:FitA-like ribbon-helix-helix domain-containing protein n=1 Tax=Roseovarius autotrophicus TaxID=2824121 RepID=UPI001B369DBB|nr:plasmid stabilization protein [Roseovarius autotrophicus]